MANEQVVHMRLGPFRFGVRKVGYTDIVRTISFALAPQERLFARTSHQYMGTGVEQVIINGMLFPKDRRFGSIAELNRMRGSSISYGLGSSLGEWHGRWFVSNIKDTQTHFHRDGTPMKVTFTVELLHAG